MDDLSRRNLWDITTPEEVAASLVIFYPDGPVAELVRREGYSRQNKQTENLRFWKEVRRLIENKLGRGLCFVNDLSPIRKNSKNIIKP